MTRLRVEKLSVEYAGNRVLDSVSLDVGDGEFLALLGKSGCGKTTLLKAIAGLIQPSEGDILFDDHSVVAKVPEARSAVMVFQKPLLFPHLSVSENVAFGLAMKGIGREERLRMAKEALELVQLPGYGDRRPSSLSGGQEQRAALARALVTKPRLLLLDEPFSALDDALRKEMRELVRDIQRRTRVTTIFVTHDQDEAVTIADRIALIHDGVLSQEGPPRDFFTNPASAEVARFFGWCVVPVEALGSRAGKLEGIPPDAKFLAFLPELARISSNPSADSFELGGRIVEKVDFGKWCRYRIMLDTDLQFTANSDLLDLKEGAQIRVQVDGLVGLRS